MLSPKPASLTILSWFFSLLLALATLWGGPLSAAPPIAPTGLRGYVSSANSLVLLWNDNSTDETVFKVFYTINTSNAGFFDLNSSTTSSTGGTSFQLSQVNPNTVYTFAIRAINAASESSAYTNTITITPSTLGAPSALTASPMPDGSIRLACIDNAATETGFFVEQRQLPAGAFTPVPGYFLLNTTVFDFIRYPPSTQHEFRLRAFTGPPENPSAYSAYSNAASVTTPAFPAPTSLTATPLPDASVSLTWVDNTGNEAGFFLEVRELPSGSFIEVGALNANIVSTSLSGLDTSKQYQFRLRAFTGPISEPVTYSSYSNIPAVTSFLVAPSGLTASPEPDGRVTLSWVDNAASEDGFSLESRRLPGGSFTPIAIIAPNIQAGVVDGDTPSTQFEFRLRAFTGTPENVTAITGYSNIASVTTAVLAPPSNFAATAVIGSPYQVRFTWDDNTIAESGYEIEYRKQGSTNFTRKVTTDSDDTIAIIPKWEPGTAYDFRIRAVNGSQVSAYSDIVSATTRNGFSNPLYSPATVGSPFTFQLTTLSQSPRVNWSVSSLPDGLTFDDQTGIISGTPTTAGVAMVFLAATFVDNSSHNPALELRILAPPQIAVPFPSQQVLQGANTTFDLDASFSTPGISSAVRLATSKGNIDILLDNTAAPLTVANFLGYVTRGDYTNVLFHRAPLGFVLQGGGYRTYAAPDVFERIPTMAPVQNEPEISNLTGTIAMAKVGGNPNSATSEFFFSLQDNSSNLDFQNGGFTVFGRASVPTLAGAVSTISNLDRNNYPIQLLGSPSNSSSTLTDLPMDQFPAPTLLDQTKIPKIISAAPVPVLSYTVTANSNPAVATASVLGSILQINGLTSGICSLTVRATDLDGNSTIQIMTVQVQQSFTQWASSKLIPNGQNGMLDNPDSDALSNVLEFAFFGNPILSDSVSPISSLAADAGSRYTEITFPVNKLAAGLTYRVEASSSLQNNSWGTIWTSQQGFSVPVVTAAVDQLDRTLVTVRDTTGSPAAPQRFLRVAVIQTP